MVSKFPEVSGPFVNVIKAIDSLLRKKMHKYKIFKQFRPIYLLTFQKLQVKELFFINDLNKMYLVWIILSLSYLEFF